MDEQNQQENQNVQEENYVPVVENPAPENHYQDYTANIQYQPVPEEVAPQNNTLSVVSLVLGILSIVGCCMGFGFMMGIGGIICSVFARKQGKNGLNTGGLITSIIGVVIGAIFTIVYVIFYVFLILSEAGY